MVGEGISISWRKARPGRHLSRARKRVVVLVMVWGTGWPGVVWIWGVGLEKVDGRRERRASVCCSSDWGLDEVVVIGAELVDGPAGVSSSSRSRSISSGFCAGAAGVSSSSRSRSISSGLCAGTAGGTVADSGSVADADG